MYVSAFILCAHIHTCGFQDEETPLIKATKMRNIEIVELLLDKGAKVSAVDKVQFRRPGVSPYYDHVMG